MQQPVFSGEGKKVTRYILLLSELVRLKPAAVEILLNHRPRDRYYFTRSEAEILRNHDYASVHPLRHGGLFAMCTLSNESKVNRPEKSARGLWPAAGDIRRLLGGF